MKHIIFIILVAVFSMNSFSQINNDHLNIGEKAPSIIGVDQFDRAINSTEVLKEQKVLLVFYRGNWCPYCRKHLASLQENLEILILFWYKTNQSNNKPTHTNPYSTQASLKLASTASAVVTNQFFSKTAVTT